MPLFSSWYENPEVLTNVFLFTSQSQEMSDFGFLAPKKQAQFKSETADLSILTKFVASLFLIIALMLSGTRNRELMYETKKGLRMAMAPKDNQYQVSNEKNLGCLEYTGIMKSRYKNPYKQPGFNGK